MHEKPIDIKRVTRADVAERAGVSETIVSYVINNNRYVDAEKRKRVEQAVHELGYQPNNAARALKGKKTNHIVFIADQIANEHFSQLIAEMDRHAYDMGYMISLCANRNTQEFVSQIISRQYDGAVISSISFQEEYIIQLVQARLPVVLLKNRYYHNMPGVAYIDTGLYAGARDCIRHFVQTGRQNIIYVDRFSKRGNFSTMNDLRYKAFWDEMMENGLPVSQDSIITGAENPGEVTEKIVRLVQSGRTFDAAFCRNDRIACITMKALRDCGVQIPQNVSVAGFDNSSLSQYTSPTLTTVSIARDKIGRAAVEMLHQMIADREIPDTKSFTANLVVRESTRV